MVTDSAIRTFFSIADTSRQYLGLKLPLLPMEMPPRAPLGSGFTSTTACRHPFKNHLFKSLFPHVTQLTPLLYTRFCLWRVRIKNECGINDKVFVGEICILSKSCILCHFCEFTGMVGFALLGASQGVFLSRTSARKLKCVLGCSSDVLTTKVREKA